MCGICGRLSLESHQEREAAVLQMVQGQQHRGPDHRAITSTGQTTVGYVRLAIQEPTEEGNQPVISGDGRFELVFNGEIYNYRELRSQYGLPARGSDAHVVVALWEKLGAACLKTFRGMYGLALVDHLEETLTIARDPFGIKPLYYVATDHCFTFCSELRPLATVTGCTTLNAETLAGYLRFGAYGADESPLDGVQALAPGTALTLSLRDLGQRPAELTIRRFASFTDRIPNCTAASAADELVRSVEAHLVSDMPVALLLSAGVDSTMLALAAARLGTKLHCLTVDGPGMADESELAAATARHYGHSHQVVAAGLDEGDLDRFIGHMQRPTIDGLNTYLVSRAVNEAGFRVALSGLGGDEALAGYSHARLVPHLRSLELLDRIPDPAKRLGLRAAQVGRKGSANNHKLRQLLLRGGPRSPVDLCVLQREVFSPSRVHDLLRQTPDLPYSRPIELPIDATPLQAWSAAERSLYMESMLLPDSDSFSMAHSVELRVPLVDLHFFAAAQGMPARIDRADGKRRLINAMDDDYLRSIAIRPKTGFGLPMRDWLLSGSLRPALIEARRSYAPIWNHLDRTRGLALLSDEGIVTRWAESWSLLALDLWLRSTKG